MVKSETRLHWQDINISFTNRVFPYGVLNSARRFIVVECRNKMESAFNEGVLSVSRVEIQKLVISHIINFSFGERREPIRLSKVNVQT